MVPWASLLIIVPVWVRSPKAGLSRTQEVDFQVNPEKQVGEREEGKTNIMRWVSVATGAQPSCALRGIAQKGRTLSFSSSILSPIG